MNENERRAVLELVECLDGMNRDRVDTAEAARRVDLVASTSEPRFGIDLLWEEQALGGALHYDALLRLPGRGTLSLSLAPEPELPWPLRGVQHARESDLLSVNGHMLTIEDAMSVCDPIWDDARIASRLVDMCLMNEALRTERISIGDAELQAALDAFRDARELYTVESTERWLAAHGMSEDALQAQLEGELARKALRDHVCAGRIDEHFAQHARAFDSAQIARFDVEQLETAERVCARVRAGTLDYFEAACERFSARDETRGKLLMRVRRGALPPEQAGPIFAAAAGDTVGPLPSGERFAVVRVLAQQRAQLDAQTRDEVAEVLFEGWLSERRALAQVEWFWGRAR